MGYSSSPALSRMEHAPDQRVEPVHRFRRSGDDAISPRELLEQLDQLDDHAQLKYNHHLHRYVLWH